MNITPHSLCEMSSNVVESVIVIHLALDHGCLSGKRSRFASPKVFAVKGCELPDFDIVVGLGRHRSPRHRAH